MSRPKGATQTAATDHRLWIRREAPIFTDRRSLCSAVVCTRRSGEWGDQGSSARRWSAMILAAVVAGMLLGCGNDHAESSCGLEVAAGWATAQNRPLDWMKCIG
jgi:hypothetical protein